MGNCSLKTSDYDPTICINPNQFEFHYPIGKGSFSKVWKVTDKATKQVYALKEILKSRVVAQRHANSALNEKTVLSMLRHPFMINMHHAFQNKNYLFLTMDWKSGGDLRYQMIKNKFVEEEAKFLVSCIVLVLEYIHSLSVIHRDVKPENLLFDEEGYIYLADFGEAKIWDKEMPHDMSGTPGYMAPEVAFQQDYSYTADWFAVGVILYEIITGSRPYSGKTLNEVKDKILEGQSHLNVENLSTPWSKECEDFVNKLIQVSPQNRLGFKGIDEIRNHPWLKYIEWDRLYRKEIIPSFKPKKGNNFNSHYVNEDWKDGITPKCNFNQDIFLGYFYMELPQNTDSTNTKVYAKRKNSFCLPTIHSGDTINQKMHERGKSEFRAS